MSLEFRAERPISSDTIDIYLFDRSIGPAGATAEPVAMKLREPGAWMPPAVSVSHTAAQQLMDELWRCGLRPSEGSGSAGSLAATERHLADMRAMAFASLKIAKP